LIIIKSAGGLRGSLGGFHFGEPRRNARRIEGRNQNQKDSPSAKRDVLAGYVKANKTPRTELGANQGGSAQDAAFEKRQSPGPVEKMDPS